MTTVYLETFGCQMNELDSELVHGQLATLGYEFVSSANAAQVLLYNTCSVREQAEQKALSRIGIVGMRKKAGERLILGVIGCMAERDGLELFRRHPQVDFLCGPGELDRVPQLVDSAMRSLMADPSAALPRPSQHDRAALAGNKSRRTATLAAAEDGLEALDLSRAFDPIASGRPAHTAFVRITRGCNKFCTYCVVPSTRGAEIHRPPQHIIDECRRLVDHGAKEVTLLGQTVNHYRYQHGSAVTIAGLETAQVGPGLSAFRAAPTARTTTFADLLRRIHEEVPELPRLRFVTSYPRDFGDDILDCMRDSPRICRYLHAPAQSGSDRILKLMNRGYTVSEYIDFVDRAFAHLPDASLAGDFIVGFPTETDDDFEATCALVRRLPFKNNFIFKYSPRPGTAAITRFADDVPDAVKRARNNALLAVQGEATARVHQRLIGTTHSVLFHEVRSRKGPRRDSNLFSPISVHGQSIDAQHAANPQSADHWQAIGRTQGDIIVAVSSSNAQMFSDFVGSLRQVVISSADSLLVHGDLVDAAATMTSRLPSEIGRRN